MRKFSRRVILAFAVAPIVPCLGVATFAAMDKGVEAFPVVFLFYVAFTYPFALVAGVPAYWGLARAGYTSCWRTALAGVLLGALCGLIFPFMLGVSFERLEAAPFAQMVLVGAAFGIVIAWAFWLIAMPRRKVGTRGA